METRWANYLQIGPKRPAHPTIALGVVLDRTEQLPILVRSKMIYYKQVSERGEKKGG